MPAPGSAWVELEMSGEIRGMGFAPILPEDVILEADDHLPVFVEAPPGRFHAEYRRCLRRIDLEDCAQPIQESAGPVPKSSDPPLPMAGLSANLELACRCKDDLS